jgi:hypothetical protein
MGQYRTKLPSSSDVVGGLYQIYVQPRSRLALQPKTAGLLACKLGISASAAGTVADFGSSIRQTMRPSSGNGLKDHLEPLRAVLVPVIPNGRRVTIESRSGRKIAERHLAHALSGVDTGDYGQQSCHQRPNCVVCWWNGNVVCWWNGNTDYNQE